MEVTEAVKESGKYNVWDADDVEENKSKFKVRSVFYDVMLLVLKLDADIFRRLIRHTLANKSLYQPYKLPILEHPTIHPSKPIPNFFVQRTLSKSAESRSKKLLKNSRAASCLHGERLVPWTVV